MIVYEPFEIVAVYVLVPTLTSTVSPIALPETVTVLLALVIAQSSRNISSISESSTLVIPMITAIYKTN